jgi:hypothetical protein
MITSSCNTSSSASSINVSAPSISLPYLRIFCLSTPCQVVRIFARGLHVDPFQPAPYSLKPASLTVNLLEVTTTVWTLHKTFSRHSRKKKQLKKNAFGMIFKCRFLNERRQPEPANFQPAIAEARVTRQVVSVAVPRLVGNTLHQRLLSGLPMRCIDGLRFGRPLLTKPYRQQYD